MATDENVSESVKLAATRDALDRGGLGIKQEIELSARPYETVFEAMEVEPGSRADYRRSQGIESPAELIPSGNRSALVALSETDERDDDGILDVEIEDDLAGTTTPGERESGSPLDSAPQPPEPPSPFEPPAPHRVPRWCHTKTQWLSKPRCAGRSRCTVGSADSQHRPNRCETAALAL